MATADWASMLARPAAQPNAVDAFSRGQNAQLDANSKLQSQNKEAFQQALTQTVEALMSKSIDDRGNPDYKTFAMLARQTPFGMSAMASGFAQAVAQRKAAAESAQAGNTMLASGVDQGQVFPKASWRSAPPSSLNAPADQTSEGQERRALPGMPGYSNMDLRGPVRRPVQSSKLAPATMGGVSGYDVGAMEGTLDGGRSVASATIVPRNMDALQGDPNSGTPSSARALAAETFDEQSGPNTMDAIQHMQTSRPDVGAAIPQRTAASVAEASPAQKQEWVRGLRAAMVKLPPDDKLTDQDIANGMNAMTTGRVRALISGMNPDKPGDSFASAATAANQAENISMQTAQEMGEKGRGMRGERLGQAATKQSTDQSAAAWESNEAARKSYAKDLDIDPNRLGQAGSKEAAADGRELKTRGGQYKRLVSQVSELIPRLPELNMPGNKNALEQEVTTLTRLVNSVSGGNSAAHSMDQSLSEIGAPKNLFQANGIKDGVRILLTNGTPAQQAKLIGALPGLMYKNTLAPVYEGYGGDPDSWKERLDAEIVKPKNTGVRDPVRAPMDKDPKVGETNGKGQTWTGKRWL
jgi:hypothetical protein